MVTNQAAKEKARRAFLRWYNSLKTYKSSGGPPRGTIATALVVLERLKQDYALGISEHTAPGGAQIKGATPAAVRKILAAFGETRPFIKEGGRTNRGARGDVEKLLTRLESAKLDRITVVQRAEILADLQGFLVERVRDYHGQQRLTFEYDPGRTTWQLIGALLESAGRRAKEAHVAQHLVGAKLAIRFPEQQIPNEAVSAADEQSGRPGDFVLHDTVFHVTVAPGQALFQKCQRNLKQGYKVYALVPERSLAAARQLAELASPGQITCQSIESFVSQNLDELSAFSKELLPSELRQLLESYNSRVDAAELDKSLLVDIPQNL